MQDNDLKATLGLLQGILDPSDYEWLVNIINLGIGEESRIQRIARDSLAIRKENEDLKKQLELANLRISFLKKNFLGQREYCDRIIKKWEEPLESLPGSNSHQPAVRVFLRGRFKADPHIEQRRALLQAFFKARGDRVSQLDEELIKLIIAYFKEQGFPVDLPEYQKMVTMDGGVKGTRLESAIRRDVRELVKSKAIEWDGKKWTLVKFKWNLK